MSSSLTDYIVIGAGSAGCVVAARLTEDANVSVVLLEAGKKERLGITKIPAALLHTIGNKRYDWAYQSEPDPTRNGLAELWPRGRVLGGSSAINGMIFIRGAPADYDAWESLGNPGWGWNDVLPLFRRLETSDEPDNARRGGLGPLRVSALRWKHPVSQSFIDTAVAAGMPFSRDLNGEQHEGVGWNQGSTIKGKRHSAYEAFVAPNLGRPNLSVRNSVLVERIVIENGRAVGVMIRQNGESLTLRARRGVVLCAGAINSPQVLMLSGIGPSDELKAAGIAPLIDSPEVGKNLMEHPGLYIQAELNTPTANHYATPLRGAVQAMRWLFLREGPMSVPTAQVLAFCRSREDVTEPDLQLHLFPYGSMLKNGKRVIPNRNLVTILVNANYPQSRGELKLRDAKPDSPIAIHPHLLDDEADVEVLLRGVELARKLCRTAPFGDSVVKLIDVPPQDAGRDADLAYLRGAARPFYHPAGTCRMGADARAVVAPDLRVRGVDQLWVADASIMPRHIAGNANATTLMIGEKASDLIRCSP